MNKMKFKIIKYKDIFLKNQSFKKLNIIKYISFIILSDDIKIGINNQK